jgi:hypothetical protein
MAWSTSSFGFRDDPDVERTISVRLLNDLPQEPFGYNLVGIANSVQVVAAHRWSVSEVQTAPNECPRPQVVSTDEETYSLVFVAS